MFSQSRRLTFPALSAIAVLALVTTTAQATIITGTSTLTQANSGLGGGTGDFGTLGISLDNLTGIATFTFTGDNGYGFVDSGAADVNVNSTTFTFSSISLSPGGLTLSSGGSGNVDGFGVFTETTDLSNASTPQTSIVYSLTSADFVGLTSISELLVANAKGWDAAAHMCEIASDSCGTNPTGFVAEAPGSTPVPEPSSLALLGTTLVGIGFFGRRHSKR